MAVSVKAVMMARVLRIAVQAAMGGVVGQGAVRVLQMPIGGRGGRPASCPAVETAETAETVCSVKDGL